MNEKDPAFQTDDQRHHTPHTRTHARTHTHARVCACVRVCVRACVREGLLSVKQNEQTNTFIGG